MPVNDKLVYETGGGRHRCSPYGICLSVQHRINISTDFCCSSESFAVGVNLCHTVKSV